MCDLARIGIAAAHHHPDSSALRRHKPAGEQRGQRGRPARFGNQPQLLPQQALRGSDSFISHQHRLAHERLCDRKHQPAHLPRPERVGSQAGHRTIHRFPGS